MCDLDMETLVEPVLADKQWTVRVIPKVATEMGITESDKAHILSAIRTWFAYKTEHSVFEPVTSFPFDQPHTVQIQTSLTFSELARSSLSSPHPPHHHHHHSPSRSDTGSSGGASSSGTGMEDEQSVAIVMADLWKNCMVSDSGRYSPQMLAGVARWCLSRREMWESHLAAQSPVILAQLSGLVATSRK